MATALLCAVLVSGCSHTIRYTTPYYDDGPHQIDPPQGDVEQGTPVLVVGREGSYARILTPAMQDVWVGSDALKPLLFGGDEEPKAKPILMGPRKMEVEE